MEFKKENLQFPNYREDLKTNVNLGNAYSIPVYRDENHSIFLQINNAEPYNIYLVDTFNDEDWDIVEEFDGKGQDIKSILEYYLAQKSK